MSKRAEMRRLQKEAVKREKLANNIGLKVKQLEDWAAITEQEMHQKMFKDFCTEFNDRLYEAEGYVSLANIIISCIAIHMTWGYTKSISRFISNVNPAKEYVKRIGVRKALEQVRKEYDLDFEFDDFDIEDFIKRAEEAEKKKD